MNDTDGIQMSFRLPSDLHIPCKELAEKNGQTFAEWIRRAMREKMERDIVIRRHGQYDVSDDELEKKIRMVFAKIEAEQKKSK